MIYIVTVCQSYFLYVAVVFCHCGFLFVIKSAHWCQVVPFLSSADEMWVPTTPNEVSLHAHVSVSVSESAYPEGMIRNYGVYMPQYAGSIYRFLIAGTGAYVGLSHQGMY